MRQTSYVALVLLIGAFSAACAGRRSNVAGGTHTQGTASSASIVTSAELSKHANGTLLDALTAIRPWLLNRGGASPGVSIDGSAPSDISTLRWIPVGTVAEVRLLRASGTVNAQTRVLENGDSSSGDVLLVVTRTAK